VQPLKLKKVYIDIQFKIVFVAIRMAYLFWNIP
jgi:hypothetical protein